MVVPTGGPLWDSQSEKLMVFTLAVADATGANEPHATSRTAPAASSPAMLDERSLRRR
ncbi:MAG: hypothetical protein M0010_15695 [Actinomycetota bacterium]|nr:hypothetical protein [Actinomycetota bacterium]